MVGRVAIVTGANTGIGLAIAERLQQDGFALGYVSLDRDDESKEQFERLAGLGAAHWASGDLSDPAVPERLVSQVVGAPGRLHLLLHNAGPAGAEHPPPPTGPGLGTLFSLALPRPVPPPQ